VVDPLVPDGADVELGAERSLVRIALGPLVDERALLTRERSGVAIVLDEVLADLRAEELEQEAQVADHRVVAQDRVARLVHVVQAGQHQEGEDDRWPNRPVPDDPAGQREGEADEAQCPRGVADGDVAVEPVDPREHGAPPSGVGRW
jgi:hypothetical protein